MGWSTAWDLECELTVSLTMWEQRAEVGAVGAD